MPKVVYDQTLTRQVEVEVTEQELAILRGNHSDERDAVQDRMLSQARSVEGYAAGSSAGSSVSIRGGNQVKGGNRGLLS